MTLEAPAPVCPEPGGPELTCPDCGSRDLYRDLEAGELVCPRCGLVVATLVSQGPEWRLHDFDFSQVRGSELSMGHLSGSGTLIGKHWKSGQNGETRAAMFRLMKQHKRTQAEDKKSRNLHHARKTIYGLAGKAKVPLSVLNQAAAYYLKAYNKHLIRGRVLKHILAACIYAAYRTQNIPRTLNELADALELPRKEVAHTYNLIVRELNLSPDVLKAEEYAARLAADLNLTWEETKTAIDLLREAHKKRYTAGKTPQGLAAGAIYLATNFRINQQIIAKAAGVTEVTVRSRYKGLQQIADSLPRFPRFPRFPTVSEG